MKVLTPREAGYAIQLTNKTLLDVRPSTEHQKVDRFTFNFKFLNIIFGSLLISSA